MARTDGGSAVYLQSVNPAGTQGTPVNPGDIWYDGTTLRFRTLLNTWISITTT